MSDYISWESFVFIVYILWCVPPLFVSAGRRPVLCKSTIFRRISQIFPPKAVWRVRQAVFAVFSSPRMFSSSPSPSGLLPFGNPFSARRGSRCLRHGRRTPLFLNGSLLFGTLPPQNPVFSEDTFMISQFKNVTSQVLIVSSEDTVL